MLLSSNTPWFSLLSRPRPHATMCSCLTTATPAASATTVPTLPAAASFGQAEERSARRSTKQSIPGKEGKEGGGTRTEQRGGRRGSEGGSSTAYLVRRGRIRHSTMLKSIVSDCQQANIPPCLACVLCRMNMPGTALRRAVPRRRRHGQHRDDGGVIIVAWFGTANVTPTI